MAMILGLLAAMGGCSKTIHEASFGGQLPSMSGFCR
jgi:hypothetical protein